MSKYSGQPYMHDPKVPCPMRVRRLGFVLALLFILASSADGALPSSLARAQTTIPQLHPPFAQQADEGWVQSASASRTLWVAADGDDNLNDGSSRQKAWRTINHGVSQMQPGDMLQVVTSTTPYTASVELYNNANGTADKPKIIRGVDSSGALAQPADRPQIIPISNTYPSQKPPFTLSSQYWILEGLSVDCNQENLKLQGDGLTGIYLISGGTDKATHIAVQHSTVRGCQNSAIEVRASEDILISDDTLEDNQNPEQVPPKSGTTPGNDSNGVTINKSSERVHITNNTASNNSADGVQCEGGEGSSKDITIEGNTFHGNLENAVDIKGCENVDIKGGNVFYDYSQPDTVNPPPCGGDAVILHNSPMSQPAKNVLIENADIYSSGVGIELGRTDQNAVAVEQIVIRRNIIHDINDAQRNCGDGIEIQHATTVEIYHNTLDKIAHSGISSLGASDCPTCQNQDVRVWNNIISNVEGTKNGGHSKAEGGALDFEIAKMPGVQSQYNLFYRNLGPAVFHEAQSGQINFQQWKGLGLDTVGSEERDPKYKSTSGPDAYTLDSGSPGLNTALPDWYNVW